MEKARRRLPPGRGFIATVLWICVIGAVWLLLSPAAFERRALQRQTTELAADVHAHWRRNIGLERWRNGLENDPSVIEREARKLGYGRPREELVSVAPQPNETVRHGERGEANPWWPDIRQTVATTLILIIAGAIAIMFFIDLKVEDAGDTGNREQ